MQVLLTRGANANASVNRRRTVRVVLAESSLKLLDKPNLSHSNLDLLASLCAPFFKYLAVFEC